MFDESDLRAALEPVRAASERPRGLPNPLYVDAGAHELERQRVFIDGWACIGHGKDVPEPGDAMPVDHVGVPLLLVRDRSGGLRLYQNICRHRGMILVSEKRNFGGVIRCPYHSWCYTLEGALKVTPHAGGPGVNVTEAIDRDATGLVPVRMGVFMDAVFANVSGTAEPFADYIRPLAGLLAEFRDQPLFYGAESHFALEIEANWKLIVENNCESYHLPWVHPGLNAYSRLEDHYHLDGPGGYAGQGTTVYSPNLDPELAFPDFGGLSAKWRRGAEYPTFFPNAFFAVHRDHFWVARIEPRGPGRSVEHVSIYYPTEEAAAADRFRDLRAKNAAQWRGVLSEDVMVTEGMQRGRFAPGFDGGTFAPVMDSPTIAFHRWVAEKLAG